MSYRAVPAPPPEAFRLTKLTVVAALLLWAATVIFAASSGYLATLYQPLIGGIVAVTIIIPMIIYVTSPGMRRFMHAIGHRRIVQFHMWRIPAALLFFWYGAQGELPPPFWILAGTGDLLAGLFALYVASRPENPGRYLRFHIFGFVDFVVAVGTGLTFTLLQDPRMAPIAALPMALIPLFGVGISGATHLMAFDMLRRGTGFREATSTESGHRGAAPVVEA